MGKGRLPQSHRQHNGTITTPFPQSLFILLFTSFLSPFPLFPSCSSPFFFVFYVFRSGPAFIHGETIGIQIGFHCEYLCDLYSDRSPQFPHTSPSSHRRGMHSNSSSFSSSSSSSSSSFSDLLRSLISLLLYRMMIASPLSPNSLSVFVRMLIAKNAFESPRGTSSSLLLSSFFFPFSPFSTSFYLSF